jgi:Ca-activated chloride channel family protein
MRIAVLALVSLATTGAGWLDPHRTAREASRLYAAGKFDDAAAKYNEALIDDPDSALLHYNLGDAAYRQGKFDDARAALGQAVAAEESPSLTARAAYNVGNAVYRLGAAAEATEPQKALELYAESLVAYRRAMGVDPSDEDAKFNHELVEKKIADLRKKLEEQQKKQDEQKQDEQKRDQQKQDQQQQPPSDQRQQGDQQPQPQDENQQQDAEEQRPQADQQAGTGDHPDEPKGGQQAGGTATPGTEPENQLAPRDAEALLDAQRDQEVRPDEVVKQLRGAGVAEPREDW